MTSRGTKLYVSTKDKEKAIKVLKDVVKLHNLSDVTIIEKAVKE